MREALLRARVCSANLCRLFWGGEALLQACVHSAKLCRLGGKGEALLQACVHSAKLCRLAGGGMHAAGLARAGMWGLLQRQVCLQQGLRGLLRGQACTLREKWSALSCAGFQGACGLSRLCAWSFGRIFWMCVCVRFRDVLLAVCVPA